MGAITPDWPLDSGVRVLTTTRQGGISNGAYDSLNMSEQVGDDTNAVIHNQKLCLATHRLPHAPRWLRQVHGTRTVDVSNLKSAVDLEADAAYTNTPNRVCAILTADCLPIVLCDDQFQEVAAVHAGWRGLMHGVLQSTISRFAATSTRLLAWIGPGISRSAYRVDPAFRGRFLDEDPGIDHAFWNEDGQWHADLYAIAESRLRASGVTNVSCYKGCTFAEPERFYSYRRDGVTGRMATFAWIESSNQSSERGEI